MNVLLIGCGSMGKRHAVNLLEINSKVNFIVMNSTGESNHFTESINAKVVKCWSEISDKLKFVILANPSFYHGFHIEKIIEQNLPAYLEKPLVTSQEELIRIKESIKIYRYDQPTLIGCNLRFLPSITILKDYIAKGTIGKICRAIFEVGQYLPDWNPEKDYKNSYHAKADLGGGVIFDLVHELDLVRYLLGNFDTVYSQYGHMSHLEIEVEDTAAIHLSRKSGPFVTVHLDYISRSPARNIKIVGDEGTLIWDLHDRTLQLKNSKNAIVLSEGIKDFDVAQTYKTAMKELLNSIEMNMLTSQDLYEGIESTELMLKCKLQRDNVWA